MGDEILEGDFIHEGETKIFIPYKEVRGRISIPSGVKVIAPHLTKVEGPINAPEAIYFEAPKLAVAWDFIKLPSAEKVNLCALTTIEVSALYAGAQNGLQIGAEELELPNLIRITGALAITKVKNFYAPNLIEIMGSIFASNMKRFHAPKLKKVKGAITLNSAEEILAESLEEITGNLWGTNATRVSLPKLKKAGILEFACSDPKLNSLMDCMQIKTKHGSFKFDEWKTDREKRERAKKLIAEDKNLTL